MLSSIPSTSQQFHQIELLLELSEPTFAVQLTEAWKYASELTDITSIFFIPVDDLSKKLNIESLATNEYKESDVEFGCKNLFIKLEKQIIQYVIFTPAKFCKTRSLGFYTDERFYKINELVPIYRITIQKRYEQLPSPLYNFPSDALINSSNVAAMQKQLQTRIHQLLSMQSDINRNAEKLEQDLFAVYKQKVTEIQMHGQYNINLIEKELRSLEEQKVRFDKLQNLFDKHSVNLNIVQKTGRVPTAVKYDDSKFNIDFGTGQEAQKYNDPQLFRCFINNELRKFKLQLTTKIEIFCDFSEFDKQEYQSISQQQLMDDFGNYLDKSLMVEKLKQSQQLQEKLSDIQGININSVNYGADRIKFLDDTIRSINEQRSMAVSGVNPLTAGSQFATQSRVAMSPNFQSQNMSNLGKIQMQQSGNRGNAQQYNMGDIGQNNQGFVQQQLGEAPQPQNLQQQVSQKKQKALEDDFTDYQPDDNDYRIDNANSMDDDDLLINVKPVVGKQSNFNPIQQVQEQLQNEGQNQSTRTQMAQEFNMAAESLRSSFFPKSCAIAKKSEQVRMKFKLQFDFQTISQQLGEVDKFSSQSYCAQIQDFFYLLQYHFMKYSTSQKTSQISFNKKMNFQTLSGLVIAKTKPTGAYVCLLYCKKDQAYQACVYDFQEGSFVEIPNVQVKPEGLSGGLQCTPKELKSKNKTYEFSQKPYFFDLSQ